MSLLDEHVVVLLTGISAAGKSTIADLLARRFARGVHVRGDAFRRMVVAGREEMAAPASDEAWRQLRLRYRLGAMVADAYHDAGFAVVVQDVVLGPVLAEYVESIRSRPLVVVVLAPRPEVILRREAERGKAAYGQGSHSVADLDRALRAETPRIGMWIDTSEQTPEHTVDDIVAAALRWAAWPDRLGVAFVRRGFRDAGTPIAAGPGPGVRPFRVPRPAHAGWR